MSHAMMAICGVCISGYMYEQSDFRIGLLFAAIASGLAATVLITYGL